MSIRPPVLRSRLYKTGLYYTTPCHTAPSVVRSPRTNAPPPQCITTPTNGDHSKTIVTPHHPGPRRPGTRSRGYCRGPTTTPPGVPSQPATFTTLSPILHSCTPAPTTPPRALVNPDYETLPSQQRQAAIINSKKRKNKKNWANVKKKTGKRLLLSMGCTLTAPDSPVSVSDPDN